MSKLYKVQTEMVETAAETVRDKEGVIQSLHVDVKALKEDLEMERVRGRRREEEMGWLTQDLEQKRKDGEVCKGELQRVKDSVHTLETDWKVSKERVACLEQEIEQQKRYRVMEMESIQAEHARSVQALQTRIHDSESCQSRHLEEIQAKADSYQGELAQAKESLRVLHQESSAQYQKREKELLEEMSKLELEWKLEREILLQQQDDHVRSGVAQEVRVKEEEIRRLEAKLNDALENCHRSEVQMGQFQKEKEELVKRTESNQSAFQAKYQLACEERNELSSNLDHALEKSTGLEKEVQELKLQVRDSTSRNDELSHDLKELEGEYERATSDLEKLESNLQEAVDRSTSLEAELKELHEERDGLRQENERLSNELQDVSHHYREVSSQHEKTMQECDEAKTDLLALDLELSGIRSSLQEKEAELVRLADVQETQGFQWNKEKTDLQEEIVGAKALIQSLMGQLEDVKADNDEDQDQDRVEAVAKEYEGRLAQAAEEISELKHRVQALDEEKKSIHDSLEECEMERDEIKRKNEQLLTSLEAAESAEDEALFAFEEAKSSLDSTRKECQEFKDKLEALAKESATKVARFQNELAQVEDDLSKTRSERDDCAKEVQSLKSELSSTDDDLKRQIQALREELKDSISFKENEITKFQFEMENKESRLQEMQSEKNELSKQIQSLKNTASDQEKKMISYQDAVESLNGQLDHARESAALAATQLETDAKEAVRELMEELKIALAENRVLTSAMTVQMPDPSPEPVPSSDEPSPDQDTIKADEYLDTPKSPQESFNDYFDQSEQVLQNALSEFKSECYSEFGEDYHCGGILSEKVPMVEYSVYEALRKKCDALQDEREELLNEAFALMDSSAAAHAAEVELLSQRLENERGTRKMQPPEHN